MNNPEDFNGEHESDEPIFELSHVESLAVYTMLFIQHLTEPSQEETLDALEKSEAPIEFRQAYKAGSEVKNRLRIEMRTFLVETTGEEVVSALEAQIANECRPPLV